MNPKGYITNETTPPAVLSRSKKATPRDKEPPARNAPCPCGSGKKYKKCCYLTKWQEEIEYERKRREMWEQQAKEEREKDLHEVNRRRHKPLTTAVMIAALLGGGR